MKMSFALLLFLKKPKVYKGGNVPIYFRITIDGVEREISTQLDVDPLKWSKEANRVLGKSEAAKSINEYLDVLQAKAINARTKLTALDKPVTADDIKALVQNKPLDAVRTIMTVFKEHNDKMRELNGK